MSEAQSHCLRCTKPFIAPAQVKGYKRFCSDKCRSEWHSELRKKALEMMRQSSSTGSGGSGGRDENDESGHD